MIMQTCEYVLGVESPLVCDLLPHADPSTGLFPAEIVDSVGKLTGDIPHKLSASREVQEEVSVQRVDAHEIPTKQKVTSTKITKKTSHSSLNTDHGESSTRYLSLISL